MCKYCEFTYISEDIGEKSNEIKRITRIKDGSQIFDLSIHRYSNDDGHKRNELILDYSIDLTGLIYTVKAENIKIKYCPFCGGEL